MDELPPSPPLLVRQNAMQVPENETSSRVCATCPAFVDDTREWVRQCSDCFRDDRTKRACKLCGQARIPVSEEAWKQVCAACFKDAPMRPCTICKEYKIKSFDPSWRTMCVDCHKDPSKWPRVCETCNAQPIRDHLPLYVKTCTKCYLEKKSQTHETCPGCQSNPLRAKLLCKRKTAPACRECLFKSGELKVQTAQQVS